MISLRAHPAGSTPKRAWTRSWRKCRAIESAGLVVENKKLIGMISEADLAQHLSEDQIALWVEKVYAPS